MQPEKTGTKKICVWLWRLTAIRRGSSHRRGGHKGPEITQTLLWQFEWQLLPPLSGAKSYRSLQSQLENAEAHICPRQDKTNLIGWRSWCARLLKMQFFITHLVFRILSHFSCTLCLLPFLTLKFGQRPYILWFPVITNKQNFLHDWFYDGLALFRLWLWFCIIKENKKAAVLRDGLECELCRFIHLNTGIFLNYLHFLLLLLHIIPLTTLISGLVLSFHANICAKHDIKIMYVNSFFSHFPLWFFQKYKKCQIPNPSEWLNLVIFNSWLASWLPWPHFSHVLLFLSEFEPGVQLHVLSLATYVMSCRRVMTSCVMRDTFGLLYRERSFDPAQTTEKTF